MTPWERIAFVATLAMVIGGICLCCQTCVGPARADQADDALGRLCPGKHAYAPHVREAARRYMLHPRLLVALMWVESRCDPKARSRAGARGLMQLLGVARNGLRGKALLDPRANIMAGARWLSLLEVWCGDLRRGLGAYNTGACTRGRGFARAVLAAYDRAKGKP